MASKRENIAFKEWLAAVDTEMLTVAGVTHRDIADQNWRDWFDSEYTPEEAAIEALEYEGFPFE